MKLLFPKQNYNVQSPRSYAHDICERFIYFQDRSAYSAAGKYVDRFWEYINRSQIHECRNWDWGRAIPRNGIHNGYFLWSVDITLLPIQEYIRYVQKMAGNNVELRNLIANSKVKIYGTLGYNDFNNLVLSGRWWMHNLILKHIFFYPFRLRLHSKVVKVLILWCRKNS